MDSLRRNPRFSRLLAAWFALAVAVAGLAPGWQAQALEVICSASGGVKALPGDAGAPGPAQGHQHQCALCAVVGAPPAAGGFSAAAPAPLQQPQQRPVFVAVRSAAPLGARGPPVA